MRDPRQDSEPDYALPEFAQARLIFTVEGKTEEEAAKLLLQVWRFNHAREVAAWDREQQNRWRAGRERWEREDGDRDDTRARVSRDQDTSPKIDEDTRVAAESDALVSSPADIEQHVLVHSTSQDNTGSVDQDTSTDGDGAQEPKSRSSPAGTVKFEDDHGPRTAGDKVPRTQIGSISAAVSQLKRNAAIAGSITTTSTTQSILRSSGRSQSHYLPEQATSECREIEKLERGLFEARSQLAELQKRCETQARDLEVSDNFLDTADRSSESDVIRALQKLNAEIQLNTTYMADCLAEEFVLENAMTDLSLERMPAVQRVSECIGQVLTKSLRSNAPEDIPMLLQIALQAYLASALCQATSAWVFEPGHNAFIYGIYQRLRKAEAQAISGRWRSLTRVHILHTWNAHPESFVKGAFSGISDILLAAGCAAPQSDIASKVTAMFEEKVALLADLAGHLGKVFDEVISSDFEVFVAIPGEKFEDKMMEDVDDDGVGIDETRVLCTTHIGLTKRIPVGTLWEKGKKQKVTVLKAKVLRESILHDEG